VETPGDIEIHDIAYDSRQVRPGSLFVAVPAVGGDALRGGHSFIAHAMANGAVAVVLQSDIELGDIPTLRVPDARAALADLAAEFYEHPSTHLNLYAVTGTDGKTTTTYLLEQILSARGFSTGLIGTVEIKIARERLPNHDRMTTPESLEVQRLLRRMVDAGVTHAAVEASSHALALQRLRGCAFAAAALTNVTADHIEFHGSWEQYFQTKLSLFTDLARCRPAVINADDTHFDRFSAAIPGDITTYSREHPASLYAENLVAGRGKIDCDFVTKTDRVRATVPLSGPFNVSNALAAAGMALTAGLSLTEIAAGLRQAQPPPGRMERIDAGQPFDILIDYAHTVHAFESVLAGLRQSLNPDQRLIAVFGAGNRDRGKRPVLAQIASRYADFFLITNEDPFDEQPTAIIEEIATGVAPEERGYRYEIEPDRGEAIARAVRTARPGDVVVITGKGHERSIVHHGRKEHWSDPDAVRRALGVTP
jgi:UDP-N-acetylmuramoyl-L-alanyl-D-glutamate--2,6-diaminopimelate ligase